MVSSSSNSASDDNFWWASSQEALLAFSVCLRMHQNAPECSSKQLKLLKFSGGACPHTLQEWKTAGRPRSLLQLITPTHPLKKVNNGPVHITIMIAYSLLLHYARPLNLTIHRHKDIHVLDSKKEWKDLVNSAHKVVSHAVVYGAVKLCYTS